LNLSPALLQPDELLPGSFAAYTNTIPIVNATSENSTSGTLKAWYFEDNIFTNRWP